MNIASETVEFYRDWRFDRSCGRIVGLGALDSERLPYQHWRLAQDQSGRVIRMEEHRPDLDLPAVKVLGYESEESPRIQEAVDFNPDGSVRLIHRYQYDAEGRMVDRVELDGKEVPRGHVVSVWEDGREVEEVVYHPAGGCRSRHRYRYDEFGNMLEEQVCAGHGAVEGIRRMIYDERHRIVEKLWHNAAGELQSRFVHEYNDSDQIIRARLYDKTGALQGERNYVFDELGNLISES